jgi:DNA-binding CsgD family transcriptional regulator
MGLRTSGPAELRTRANPADGEGRPPLTVELLGAALDAALTELADEAFLVDSRGIVLYASPAARARIAKQGKAGWPHFAFGEPNLRRRVVRIAGAASQVGWLVFGPRTTREDVAADAARRWSLTPRQTEVLAHLIAGDFNKEIAFALACSRRAVEHHITAILRKTATHSRAELLGRVFRAAAGTDPTADAP